MQMHNQVRGNVRLSTAGTPQSPESTTVRYVIDTRGSTFTVRAFATGLLSMFGHSPTISIPDFEGQISLNPDAVEQSSVRMVIYSASLIVIDDISKKDRDEMNRQMHQDVLESDSFPDIVYECSRVSASKTGEGQYWVALNGELTLHGVTHSPSVSARVSLNGDTLRAMGDFSIRQSDYGIRPVAAAAGTVKLKDELKLSFDISARKQA
jgi:polyisoprenoid-binding protein YceI